MGRHHERRCRGSKQAQPAVAPAQRALREAQALQQQAERRRDEAAAATYEQAVAKFREALAMGDLEASAAAEAAFGLGESLQGWAEAGLEATRKLPDGQCSVTREAAAGEAATRLLQEAVANYELVVASPADVLHADALVNCGNALAAAADAALQAANAAPGSVVEQALAMLAAAERRYEAALAREEDAATWSNRADALTRAAEVAADAGRPEAASLYSAARQAYGAACSLSHAEEGDDLPGLLHNWGVGLLSHAQHTAAQSERAALLNEAVTRLRESIAFSRADPAPCAALGDALAAVAEGEAEAEAAGCPPHSSSGADSTADARRAALEMALREGYGAALRIDAGNADALVGCAEVHSELGRMAAAAADAPGVTAAFCAAADAYTAALQRPEALGGFRERADVRYNAACCLVLAGREQEAAPLLSALLACGGSSVGDVASDADFDGVRGELWFQQLLAAHSGPPN